MNDFTPTIDPSFQSLIRPLAAEEYSLLEESICKEGCRDALVAWDGILLDGHNRLTICQKHGIEYATVNRDFPNHDEAKAWVIKNQIGRRNVSSFVRAELSLMLEPSIREKAKEQQGTRTDLLETFTKSPALDTREELAKQARVSGPTIDKVRAIVARAPEEVKEQLRAGEITINSAFTDMKREEARERVLSLHAPVGDVQQPTGLYRCIVIDPPWPMKRIERDVRPNQPEELAYPVMSLEEIECLPIPDLAEPDGCHVYLWVTQKYLPVGLDLFKAWGVQYQCAMTWVKNVGFTPFSWMYDTEHVLFGRIGSLQLTQLGLRLSFNADVAGHSVKPTIFFERVALASPEPRLEMFCRGKHDGFASWGNEVSE